jgi:Rrf2 family protein
MIRNDTDYALRMLIHLAERSPHGASALELSKEVDVPHGFAQKILRKLATGGFVRARPGRRGGFTLNQAPERVLLMDVVTLIQGAPLLIRCLARPDACSRHASCRIQATLHPLQASLDAFLGKTSLSDMVNQSPSGILPPCRAPEDESSEVMARTRYT